MLKDSLRAAGLSTKILYVYGISQAALAALVGDLVVSDPKPNGEWTTPRGAG